MSYPICTFVLFLSIFCPFSYGAARFTQVPSNKLYVFKGETARFVWDYHVDNINELDSASPTWSFYDPNAKRIGYDYKYDSWNWWIDNNTCPLRLRSPTVRVSKQSTATLVITGVTTADNGEYGCTLVLKQGGSLITSKVQLIVTETPTFTVRPNASTTINEHSDLRISCLAVGPPTPNVTWVQVQGITKVTMTQGVGSATLSIPNIKRVQNGTYECQLVNNPNQNPVTAQTKVIVYYPSKITHKTSDKTACLEYKVTLVCYAEGNPVPTIQWYHGDTKVESKQPDNTHYARYVFTVERDDQYGSYTCKANNSVGNDTFEMRLTETNVTCSPPTSAPPTPSSSPNTVHPGIIAGVVIAAILAIAGLVIAIIFCHRRKSLTHDSRIKVEPTIRTSGLHGEEEQYASVQVANRDSTEEDEPIPPQYAVVDKSKKKKKKTPGEGELVYADLDHDLGDRPPSDRRPTDSSNDPGTLYADIGGAQHQPPPRYGNLQNMDNM